MQTTTTNPSRPYVPRINTGGNYCGHDSTKPDFTLIKPVKKGKRGLPRVLTLCMERIEDYYHRPRKVLPSLDQANSSQRQQRSERRESCLRLITALLNRTDLTSLRVGVPTQDGFLNYTVDYIAKDTGMNLKRVERALRDLKAAGLITVSQPRQRLPDGSWKGLAAVKALSKLLFGVVGLARMLKIERGKASKRQKRKEQAWANEVDSKPTTRTGRARGDLMIAALVRNQSQNPPMGKAKYSQPRATDPPDDPEHRKRLMLKAAEIKQAHMDWSRDKCFEEAAK